MEETPTNDELHKHQVNAGRAGGRSRSDAKRQAVRENLAKARLKRWPGREAAAISRLEASNVQEGRPQVVPEAPSPNGGGSSGNSGSSNDSGC